MIGSRPWLQVYNPRKSSYPQITQIGADKTTTKAISGNEHTNRLVL
jgi:hypothetical protein